MSQAPVDAEGNPMAVVSASITDTIPTVQYGAVKLWASITRPVPNGTDEELINATRQVMRDVEFVVGVERRSLQYALDPTAKVAGPPGASSAAEVFAAPPAGYDPASMPAHPGDVPAPEAAAKT